jgi:hypothetical protein
MNQDAQNLAFTTLQKILHRHLGTNEEIQVTSLNMLSPVIIVSFSSESRYCIMNDVKAEKAIQLTCSIGPALHSLNCVEKATSFKLPPLQQTLFHLRTLEALQYAITSEMYNCYNAMGK